MFLERWMIVLRINTLERPQSFLFFSPNLPHQQINEQLKKKVTFFDLFFFFLAFSFFKSNSIIQEIAQTILQTFLQQLMW